LKWEARIEVTAVIATGALSSRSRQCDDDRNRTSRHDERRRTHPAGPTRPPARFPPARRPTTSPLLVFERHTNPHPSTAALFDSPSARPRSDTRQGTVTVIQGDTEEAVEAPGVVLHERGEVHGARNDTDERAVLTASLCPLPS